jgi:hypothetical protein
MKEGSRIFGSYSRSGPKTAPITTTQEGVDMNIGEEKREIIVVPVEQPVSEPVPAAPEPVPAEPAKEPVGV